MTTEKHDPWALLAEIHEIQPWLSQDADLAARVETALRTSSTPVYRETARLDTMWQQILRERDEAKEKVRQTEAMTNAAFQRGVETFRRHILAFALGATSYERPSKEAQVILDELPRMQVDDPEAGHGNR